MSFNYKNFEKKLAENKVYNAWQYIYSLRETITYMEISFEILKEVYQYRKSILSSIKKEKFNELSSSGKFALTVNDLNKTELDIGGYKLNDIIFLRKTTIEFFHYSRICMDTILQIINAALLGDEAFSNYDTKLLSNLLKKLKSFSEFSKLLEILETSKNDERFQYLMAFDNYIKHIRTVSITVKNSIIIGNIDEFEINSFYYKDKFYDKKNALDIAQDICNYTTSTIDTLLNEISQQVSNCISNDSRIQDIIYKYCFKKQNDKTYLTYVSFFIDVPNGITDLPPEIKVHPLLIKPNDEICDFDFTFNKIFIKKKGANENGIVGVATLKNGLDTNEFYKIYEVKKCDYKDYMLYIATFNEKYKNENIKLNLYAMKGEQIFLNE